MQYWNLFFLEFNIGWLPFGQEGSLLVFFCGILIVFYVGYCWFIKINSFLANFITCSGRCSWFWILLISDRVKLFLVIPFQWNSVELDWIFTTPSWDYRVEVSLCFPFWCSVRAFKTCDSWFWSLYASWLWSLYQANCLTPNAVFRGFMLCL